MDERSKGAMPMLAVSRPKAIAIIGMACRFPAGATNVENLWTALASGQSGWSPHPRERYLPERFYHPNPDKIGTYYSKGAHYLEEDFTAFDAQFFNITAGEAQAMDPQQRHLLEISYEALENAGVSLPNIAGTNMGVFIGANGAQHRHHVNKNIDNIPILESIGNAESLQANRISYVYDLRGPSLTIDTACSSSLAALNSAFLSLQAGESSTAIVASSLLHIAPSGTVSISAMRLLSPDGRCYAFDDRATSGFGRGEGSGCIVLKPLEAALKDGDPIRSIICNSGVNQDGKTAGITMPNGEAQASLIQSVYHVAGLDPLQTDYVEAHGTGTATGDPIEAAALGKVFGRTHGQPPVIVGSLKSNIGHLEAASGVASVIKTALMLERGFYVPNCDLQRPNRKIPFQKMNFKVSHKFRPWDCSGVRRASVNNFGFGGTNAHVIMEEALSKCDIRALPEDARASLLNSSEFTTTAVEPPTKSYLFLLSANDRESVLKTTALVAEYLYERPAYSSPDIFRRLAFTLGQRRTLFPWKVAMQAKDHYGLIQQLKDVSLTPTRSVEQPRIGLVFTGQGSQWPRMGTHLYHAYPIYASAIQKVDHILTGLGASWSLIAELEKSEKFSSIDSPSISQPACTALQLALVDLLHSWGIAAHSVIGHSSGEIAAAYAAGILGMESCVAIAYYRGLVATTWIEENDGISGGMLAVGASQEDVQKLIDIKRDIVGECNIACINSPKSITVSGDAARISQVSALADANSIWNRRLKVEVAYHSHHMNAVADQYASLLGEVKPIRDAGVQFHSSLQGHMVDPDALNASYWVNNLTSPVRFSEAFTSLCEPKGDSKRGVDLVIEIGPHSTLQGPIRQIIQTFEGSPCRIQSFSSIVRNADSTTSLLDLSARLVTNGCKLKLANVNFPFSAPTPNVLVDLPNYQWNHTKRYWYEVREEQEELKYLLPRHDLLGYREPGCSVDAPQWKNMLTVEDVPWLRDHCIQDIIVFPMAGYLCMAIEACRQQAQWKGRSFDRVILRHVNVARALTLAESAAVELRLSFAPWNDGSYSASETWSSFKVSSWTGERGWIDHCKGLVAATLADQQNPVCTRNESRLGLGHQMGDLSELRDRCTESKDVDQYYAGCDAVGSHFGPTFRRLREVQMDPSRREGTFKVVVPDTLTCMPYNRQSDYLIHPISLDVIFQTGGMFQTEDQDPNEGYSSHMPVSFQELTVGVGMVDNPGSVYQMHATSTARDPFSRRRTFDCVVLDMQRASHPSGIVATGVVQAPVQGMDIAQEKSESRCLRTQWEPSMSYLDQGETEAMLSLPPPRLYDLQASRKIEEMGLDYIKQALEQTNFDEVAATYVRKLYAWMKSKVSEASGDHLNHKTHEPNGNVSKSKTRLGFTDDVAHGINKDLNGEILVKAEGNAFNSKGGGSHSVAANGQASIDSAHDALKDRILNERLPSEHTTNEDIPIGKVYNESNGILTKEQSLIKKISDVNTHEGSVEDPSKTSNAHAESIQLAMSLMRRVGAQLPAILRGQVDPAVLMSEDNLLSRFTLEFEGMSRLYYAAATYIQKLMFQSPVLRILEIGDFDGLATARIVEGFSTVSGTSSRSVQYEMLRESTDMLPMLAPYTHILKQRKFDPTKSLSSQDLENESYDVIIMADNYLSRNQKKLTDVRSLLKTGGRLILFQNLHDRDSTSLLPLATLQDWWVEDGDNCNRSANGYGKEVESGNLWEACGFSGPQMTVQANSERKQLGGGASVLFITAAATTRSVNQARSVVVVAQWLPHGVYRSQIKAAVENGNPAAIEWVEFNRLADINFEGRYCVVVDNPREHYLTKLTAESFEGMKPLTQAAGVLWMTGGLLSPNAGLVRGLARTLRAEFQIQKFVTLAIEDWSMPGDDLVELIRRVFEQSFYSECNAAEYDRELAVRDGVVHIPRLVHDNVTTDNLNRETLAVSRYLQPFYQEGRPLRLTITNPGVLSTLSFVNDERLALPLPEDEIEIEIRASGLNFKDVILALGQLPGYYLGQECSGVVTKTGSSVSRLEVGDRIAAIATGCFANVVRCKADCAVKLPQSISFPDGASIPLIYCTAHYCLTHVARLKPGETILIHAAAGGVGQSAIMLAQALKAKVLATVGSKEKKTFLMQEYGIPEDHIFYSRDISFVQGVTEATNKKGVDVVLNSLAGEQLRASWRCMAPFGRFIEIGKRDITTNMYLEMAPFEKTVTFAGVDLGDLIHLRPETLQEVFMEVMDLIAAGCVKPVGPVHNFAVSDIERAFRSLQSGKLTGKVVITPRSGDMVMASRPTTEPAILREDVSYLITGGTGGIGRAICSWMAQHGAKNIILSSRSGKKQVNIMEMVNELGALGVKVEVYQSNVAIAEDLQRLVSDCAKSMPRIGGVIHGAYVNKDVAFELAKYQDWIDVVQPKYQGAWNMHNSLPDLDFFIMLSSTSAVIGNRGQAAYAAANCFLDDFAHYRASQGLSGTSINLGVVKEIGHVAERPELQKKLESLSDVALSKADVLALIKLAIIGKIDQHADHQCAAGLSFENFSSQNPAFYWATDARFCHLRRGMGVLESEQPAPSISTKGALKKAQSIEKAAEITISALTEKFASVLMMPAEEVRTDKPLTALGLDSLVAVEVRSWLGKETDTKMSAMELMTSASIRALADVIVGKSSLLEGLRSKSKEA